MSVKFYPYLWYLQLLKRDFNIFFDEYNPYLILNSNSLNSSDNQNFYVNLPMFGIDENNIISEEIIKNYILILSKIEFTFLISPFSYITDNKVEYDEDYVIRKYRYKLRYTKDYVYLFKNALKEIFFNSIIYKKDDKFLIYLDYERNNENENKMKKLITNFIYFNIEVEYVFTHFLILDIKEISCLDSWELL